MINFHAGYKFGLIVRFIRMDAFAISNRRQIELTVGSNNSYYASLLVSRTNMLRRLDEFIYEFFGLNRELHILTDIFLTVIDK